MVNGNLNLKNPGISRTRPLYKVNLTWILDTGGPMCLIISGLNLTNI
jgi:hypothetical protein